MIIVFYRFGGYNKLNELRVVLELVIEEEL